MVHKKSACARRLLSLVAFILNILLLNIVSSGTYEISFTTPDLFFTTNERIELKGNLSQINSSIYAPVPNANINITIVRNNGANTTNYTLITDANGTFYSNSTVYPNSTTMNAPSTGGDYFIRAEYNATTYSELDMDVINKTIDVLTIRPEKATYKSSESVKVSIEAIKVVGDRTIYVANISVNGSLKNSAKNEVQNISCITGDNGKCSATVTAPSNPGENIIEIENFKSSSRFIVVPFYFNIYMKDELGKSLKNIFAIGEQGRIEVSILNASSNERYSFSGYIADSSGNVIKSVDTTQLNNNNSFINSFLFTVDSLTFDNYGSYRANLTITKSGGSSISAYTSFEVEDWSLSINKKTANSGFEYEHSIFPNKTMRFEAYPSFRSNGSIIDGINASFFAISLKDKLNNLISTTNANWNASCGKNGCYEFSLTSPNTIGKYILSATVSYGGSTQIESRTINVINAVMSAQSTDKDGNLKELFGANEFVYITLNAYNLTSSQFNLSDAEIFLVTYMNGSEFSYIQTAYNLVNLTNTAYEWGWNSTLQRIKLDVPKVGGVYDVFVFGNNRSVGALSKFIVNPYNTCVVAKDSVTSSGSGSSVRYVWQFKTTDTIYFEIKLYQANNPLGKASALNLSGNSSMYGMGATCFSDSTKQAVINATLNVLEVKNIESGALENFNGTDSVCQSDDSSGGYTCTIKPLTKWSGGLKIVKLNVRGQDGTSALAYGTFDARAFYLYGYSSTWQNSPAANISLNLRLYEAGSNWWTGGGSSGGISGTVTLKKVEYQGRDGEWIWPPVDYGYNTSQVNSSSITTGAGSFTLPAQYAPGGRWKTGNYRVVLQATTSSGDTDYGYAWFGIKLWDVYGTSVECSTTGCNYKWQFNSRENVTLYIRISQAGSYNYGDYGGASLGGNVNISIKKIEDCRKWPCKELNSSQYTSTKINVNSSSPWYWNSNIKNSSYFIYVNTTSGTWGSGYYSVTLDINGTDTGSAWFNTIAFYADTQPTNATGAYKYNIRGNQPMYFNVTTTKGYKYGYWYNGSYIRYNESDFINVTINDAVLRTWDQQTFVSKEYNYPEELNITPLNITGSGIVNITYKNGTWPTGYYWGELVLTNSENESSSGWLWFGVQPFRAQLSTSTYTIDSDQCVNASLSIFEPDWWNNVLLPGNYSINATYENVWSGSGNSIVSYSNVTLGSFNATANLTFCPNSGSWGGGSWGGYHYLNVVIKDNIINDTQAGWLSFKATPFQVTWGSVVGGTNKLPTQNITVPVTITKPLTGANTTANLTMVYQWRYDNFRSTKEEYVFNVGACYSNISSSCNVTGTKNVLIFPPSGGWKIGYNYLYSVWKASDGSLIEDWGGIYIEGRESYNGQYENVDSSGYWKYYFAPNENITIRLRIKDSNYNSVNVNITNVQYALSPDGCWSDWCRTYSDATWSLIGGGVQTSSGTAIITIRVPSGGWTRGYYYIKTSISGSAGTATITNGNVRVKDFAPPNITVVSPTNNATYTSALIPINFTTVENGQCSISVTSYDNFYSWYCGAWNATNSTSSQISNQTKGACNTTLYSYSGNSYYTDYIYANYRSTYDGQNSSWSSYSTGLVTGGTTHRYMLNMTNRINQHYGVFLGCNDDDYNYASALIAFKLNL